ncbi:unnamed protein product [Haemonchus placei]|uniref:DUF2052 domain-containing protein n=1 Tax=Haemonchus placei TaxID=6290 RepID=A0A0N4X768_HAEPC|nr:unnamed protein product [Haemonchus placei]
MPLSKLEENCSLEHATAGHEHRFVRKLGYPNRTFANEKMRYDEEELEAFYMDLESLYREDHTFFKVIVGDSKAKIGPRRKAEELHIGTRGMEWNEQGVRLSDHNVDEEYDRFFEYLRDSAREAESLKDGKKRLSLKTLELIRERGIVRATGNHQQTPENAKLYLKERRAAVMDEAAEAGKSIRKADRASPIKRPR